MNLPRAEEQVKAFTMKRPLRQVLVVTVLLVGLVLGNLHPAEARGLRRAFKGLLRRFFSRQPGAENGHPADSKGQAAPSDARIQQAPPAAARTQNLETKIIEQLPLVEMTRYGSEASIMELEAAFHTFAANLYQSQLMLRGALSRLVTAVKRVVLPNAGEYAVHLWYVRQRAVNLYFDSRVLALRCLYIAYFPVPTTESWDTRDVVYRRRKLLHFLGTYHLLDARLTLLKGCMEKLLASSSEIFVTQGRGPRTTTTGAVIQTIGLYLADGFNQFHVTLSALKDAVVSSIVFPYPRDRAYRALHRAVLDVQHVLNVARSALDASIQFRRGSSDLLGKATYDHVALAT